MRSAIKYFSLAATILLASCGGGGGVLVLPPVDQLFLSLVLTTFLTKTLFQTRALTKLP